MKNDTARFADRLAATAHDIEALLDQLLGPAALSGETARPPRLVAAMRHAALDGGKRLRPFLVVETAALFDVNRTGALMAGGTFIRRRRRARLFRAGVSPAEPTSRETSEGLSQPEDRRAGASPQKGRKRRRSPAARVKTAGYVAGAGGLPISSKLHRFRADCVTIRPAELWPSAS